MLDVSPSATPRGSEVFAPLPAVGSAADGSSGDSCLERCSDPSIWPDLSVQASLSEVKSISLGAI